VPNTYTFQFPLAQAGQTLLPIGNTGGKFIANLKGFKALNFLNGRRPATGFIAMIGGVQVYLVNVNLRASDVPWDGIGFLSPLSWSVFAPAPSVPAAGSNLPPGFGGVLLTAKKTGRPFDLQVGRRPKVKR